MPADTTLGRAELVRQVKALYRQVAQELSAAYHFPIGRPLAQRLGYPADLLDRIPAEALAAFARVLAPGGRLAIADIVATRPLPQAVTCNADLWSACIGGATPQVDYRAAIEAAGLTIDTVREVPEYEFLTTQAQNASREYGVRA